MNPSLEYFTYIAKYNNITRAAEELHITQQCLSNYLKKLENYYGVPLFNRKPVMSLTPFGKSVYNKSLIIQDIHNEIDISLPYFHADNPIGIGFSILHIYNANYLVDIRKFVNSHKGAAIKFRHGSLQTLTNMLSKGDVDLYFTSLLYEQTKPWHEVKPATDLITKKAKNYNFKLIVTKDLIYDYFGKQGDEMIAKWTENGVKISEISPIPLILLNQIRGFFFTDAKENGYKINLAADCDNVHLIMEMVAQNIGYGVIPNYKPSEKHKSFFEFYINEPIPLRYGSIYCCTTESALSRPIVRDLWNSIESVDNEEVNWPPNEQFKKL